MKYIHVFFRQMLINICFFFLYRYYRLIVLFNTLTDDRSIFQLKMNQAIISEYLHKIINKQSEVFSFC